MKFISSLLLLIPASLVTTMGVAQKMESSFLSVEDSFAPSTVRINDNKTIKSANEAILFLKEYFNQNEDYGFVLKSEINSPFEKHYTFVEVYQEIEVYQSTIKINTTKDGEITSIFSSFQEVDFIQNEKAPISTQITEYLPFGSKINSEKLIWVSNGNSFQKGILVDYNNEIGLNFEVILNQDYEQVLKIEKSAHFSANDTTAKAMVFAPDPITSANTTYTGDFKDNNDATNDSLDKYRELVDLNLTYDNGVFILENDFIKITEHSLPVVTPVNSTTPEFFYNRSESGFEDVNVFYHITQQQLYLQSLGFTNLVDYQIAVDCHGFGGADNSAFTSSTNPPTLTFGEGGVDDAEDTDVIIHEYTHAILESAAPNTNFGTQRNAMDEGYGDYMAVSYSREYDLYQDSYVFNWDGHNEYWDGRLVTSNAMYPTHLQYNLYKDAPMWSSAMLRIERNTSREVAHTISLQAAYSYTSNMTMAQGAQLIIEKDSLIYNGDHYAEVCWVFKDKGMVDTCFTARPNNMVGVSLISNSEHHFIVRNSSNFAYGTGNIQIDGQEPFELTVLDLTGKIVAVKPGLNNQLQISPDQLKSGVYLFQIKGINHNETVKVIRY